MKKIQKLEIQGRGEEEEENDPLLGCQKEQPRSVSCHEASSWLGLRHGPAHFAWGMCA